MDSINPGLQATLNQIRSTLIEQDKLYGQNIPKIEADTSFGEWASPLLNNDQLFNEFVPQLIDQIIKVGVNVRYYNNPLRFLEGEEIPLGQTLEEIDFNPVKGRRFDPNDFAGILQKYESDVKVQFRGINAKWQYPLSISYDNIRGAMTSWGALKRFIDGQIASIYNGYYIDDYRTTKGLIGGAYQENAVIVKQVTAPTDKSSAEAIVQEARALALNMRVPSSEYNAWSKVGGAGKAFTTFTDTSDMIVFVKNSVMALLDVQVQAMAFQLGKAEFIGQVIGVDNFDVYDDDGNVVFDGSDIVLAIGDRRWFKINPQMVKFDQQYIANNTTWQNYLRVNKGYHYSFTANMVVLSTSLPSLATQSITFPSTSYALNPGADITITPTITPYQTTTVPSYTVSKNGSTTTDLTLAPSTDGKSVTVTATESATGTYVLTAKADAVTVEVNININAVQKTATASNDETDD